MVLKFLLSDKKIAHTKFLVDNSRLKAVPVVAIKNGIIEMKFKSIHEAHNAGFKKSSVSLCIRGIKKQHKGYIWKTA